MKKELNNLDELKRNPFKTPDGYMDNLTSQIMSQIPEKPVQQERKVTLMDRMRPWMYMAAMFAGLGLFFRFFVGTPETMDKNDGGLSQTGNVYESVRELREAEEEDYFEFINSQYEGVLLADEWKYFD